MVTSTLWRSLKMEVPSNHPVVMDDHVSIEMYWNDQTVTIGFAMTWDGSQLHHCSALYPSWLPARLWQCHGSCSNPSRTLLGSLGNPRRLWIHGIHRDLHECYMDFVDIYCSGLGLYEFMYIYIYVFLIKLWMVYGCKRMFIPQIDGIIKCIS